MQRVTADEGLDEESIRVVTINWRTSTDLLEREIVGEEVLRATARQALLCSVMLALKTSKFEDQFKGKCSGECEKTTTGDLAIDV